MKFDTLIDRQSITSKMIVKFEIITPSRRAVMHTGIVEYAIQCQPGCSDKRKKNLCKSERIITLYVKIVNK